MRKSSLFIQYRGWRQQKGIDVELSQRKSQVDVVHSSMQQNRQTRGSKSRPRKHVKPLFKSPSIHWPPISALESSVIS